MKHRYQAHLWIWTQWRRLLHHPLAAILGGAFGDEVPRSILIRVSMCGAVQLAEAWGSEYVLLGARGHIGSAAKLGMWKEGLALLNKLREKVG